MKTYHCGNLSDALSPFFRKISKKFDKKINFLKTAWEEIAPPWALEAKPYMLKKNLLIMKAKKNALILQFKEKELLKIVRLIIQEVDCLKIQSD